MYEATHKDLNRYYQRWLNSKKKSIFDAYPTPSRTHLDSWIEIQNVMRSYSGNSLRITNHAAFEFSAGFVTDTDFYIINRSGIFTMPLSEVK